MYNNNNNKPITPHKNQINNSLVFLRQLLTTISPCPSVPFDLHGIPIRYSLLLFYSPTPLLQYSIVQVPNIPVTIAKRTLYKKRCPYKNIYVLISNRSNLISSLVYLLTPYPYTLVYMLGRPAPFTFCIIWFTYSVDMPPILTSATITHTRRKKNKITISSSTPAPQQNTHLTPTGRSARSSAPRPPVPPCSDCW